MAGTETVNVYKKAKSFSAAPKFSGYDMVVLNLGDDLYVSSPYALVDKTKWANRSNGLHTFEYVGSRRLFQYNGGSFITIEDLDTVYGITIEYYSDSDFTDGPKDGDTVTVSKFVNEDNVSITSEFSRAGTKLETNCPLVHPEMRQAAANNLLKTMYGVEYQPYEAGGAIVNPAAELGDGVQAYGHYGGLYKQKITFSSLMSSDISAPGHQESESEFPYEPEQNREFKRSVARVSATFSIFADRITAEVQDLTNEVESYDSRITQTAQDIVLEAEARVQADNDLHDEVFDENDPDSVVSIMKSQFDVQAGLISAKVSKTGGEASSFGWTLTDNSWTLSSGNVEVFKANSSGITVRGSGEFSGKITASSGAIGGFNISRSAIWNGIETMADAETTSGVYVGTNGIKLGQSFQVTNTGRVTASDLRITGGSINLGDAGDGTPVFQVNASGQVTMKRGSITLGSDSQGNPVFRVTNTGAVTASNLRITGGSIALGDIGDGTPVFNVSTTGAVTASNLRITGGSISIGTAFSVDSQGRLSATSGNFSGTIYAGNIVQGGGTGDGTMSGGLITAKSIDGDSTLKANSIGTSSGGAVSAAGISAWSGGANFNSMEAKTRYADWVCGNHFICANGGNYNGSHYGSWTDDVNGTHYVSWNSVSLVQSFTASATPSGYIYVKKGENSGGGEAIMATGYNISISAGQSKTLRYLGY